MSHLTSFQLPATPKRLAWSFNRCVMLLSLASFGMGMAPTAHANPDELEIGRRIYTEGVLPSGQMVQGSRQDSVQLEGQAAACEACHRRSGMGSLEGNIVIPPITGNFLFSEVEKRPVALVDPREPRNITRPHEPYTESSFAKVLREGVSISGKTLNPLMPKYALSDQEIKAVMAYLRQLSPELSSGVGDEVVHFATIVTPDVSTQRREALVGMINTAFKQRNASQQNYSGRMRMPLDLLPRTTRNWTLTLWELKGAPETWGEQLAEYYQREPVFAVVSGLSETTWEPVDRFCEQTKLPCLFPNITTPPTQTSYYSLYYSRGLALEAGVVAKHLKGLGPNKPKRVIEIYRDESIAQTADSALQEAIKATDLAFEKRIFDGSKASAQAVMANLSASDAVVFWLGPDDLTTLQREHPTPTKAKLFISGTLLNDNFSVIDKHWQSGLRLIYPYEIGKVRDTNARALKSWLTTWKLPLVDELMQTQVFFNLLFLTDLSSQMLDNLYRDYLIERAEDMLSVGTNSSAYPHLSLSKGQRFGSKGAYIAQLSPEGKLIKTSDWIVP